MYFIALYCTVQTKNTMQHCNIRILKKTKIKIKIKINIIGSGGDDCVSVNCEDELNACFSNVQCVNDISSQNISLCAVDEFVEEYCNDPEAPDDGRCNEVFDSLVTCVIDECVEEECGGDDCMSIYCSDEINTCFENPACVEDVNVASNQSTCDIPEWKEEYCSLGSIPDRRMLEYYDRCGVEFEDVFNCFIENCFDDECGISVEPTTTVADSPEPTGDLIDCTGMWFNTCRHIRNYIT